MKENRKLKAENENLRALYNHSLTENRKKGDMDNDEIISDIHFMVQALYDRLPTTYKEAVLHIPEKQEEEKKKEPEIDIPGPSQPIQEEDSDLPLQMEM